MKLSENMGGIFRMDGLTKQLFCSYNIEYQC